MKATFTVNVKYDSWFLDEKEPKTQGEWQTFFEKYFLPNAQVVGVDETQELIILEECIINNFKIS